MKVLRQNEARSIGQVDTFYPEDDLQMFSERFSVPLLSEFLEKIKAADPLRFDMEHPPGVRLGYLKAQKGGFGLLVLTVDSGVTYVVAPLANDNLQHDTEEH